MSIFVKILLGVLIVGVFLLILNWNNIQRLIRVKSMFDADKIVHSFSHMSENLFADKLERSGVEHIWPTALNPLPETYMDRGNTKSTTAMLKELDTTALVVVKDGAIVFEDYYKSTGAEDLRI